LSSNIIDALSVAEGITDSSPVVYCVLHFMNPEKHHRMHEDLSFKFSYIFKCCLL